MAQAHIDEGKAYIAEKLASGDYHQHETGFLYRFITQGQTGKGESNNSSSKPGPTEQVQVHYEGKLINGKVFDSSFARGEKIKFGLNQVIKGWGLAVGLMSYGDKIECILPQELAYGMRGAGQDIPGGATLIFIIEYFETVKSAVEIAGKKFYDEQLASGQWIEDPEGYLVQYISGKPEEGAEKPTVADEVTAHYVGTLIDGTVFDSSVARGQPSSFALAQVISGWTSSIPKYMTKGTKAKFVYPADLAYGDRSPSPKIPADSTLIFEIELFSWKPAPPQECNIM